MIPSRQRRLHALSWPPRPLASWRYPGGWAKTKDRMTLGRLWTLLFPTPLYNFLCDPLLALILRNPFQELIQDAGGGRNTPSMRPSMNHFLKHLRIAREVEEDEKTARVGPRTHKSWGSIASVTKSVSELGAEHAFKTYLYFIYSRQRATAALGARVQALATVPHRRFDGPIGVSHGDGSFPARGRQAVPATTLAPEHACEWLGINLTAADAVVFYNQDYKIMQRASEKRQLEAPVIAKGTYLLIYDDDPLSCAHTIAEIAAPLLELEGEHIEVVLSTAVGKRSVTSDAELDMLLDRKEIFEGRGVGWKSGAAGKDAWVTASTRLLG
ncbi:hypothetical protein BJV74DRAFT_954113 [Russula compacta]|nr:hypothetical protein BJV74DRAFT_954113 [Russula compacta]